MEAFSVFPRGVRVNMITLHPSNFKFSPVHMELSAGKTKSYKNIIPFSGSGSQGSRAGRNEGFRGEDGQLTRLLGQKTSGVTDPGPPPNPGSLTSLSPHSHDQNGRSKIQSDLLPGLPWFSTALQGKPRLHSHHHSAPQAEQPAFSLSAPPLSLCPCYSLCLSSALSRNRPEGRSHTGCLRHLWLHKK